MRNSNLSLKPEINIRKKDEILLDGKALKKLLKDVLERGQRFRFKASGFSMQPFIRNGDVITLAPFFNSEIKVGDVVACEEPGSGKLIVHRVVWIKGIHYLIKGDNSLRTDGWIQRDSIYGRVIRVERKGKTVSFPLGLQKYLIAFISRDWLGRRFLCYLWQLIWLLRRGFVTKGHL